MKRIVRSVSLVLAMSVLWGPAAADTAAIRRHVETLADDAMQGRLAGSAGERRAADYLAGALADLGAKPLPGREGFLLPFHFTAGMSDDGSRLMLGETTWASTEHVQALSFSDTASATGPVVFAGYGLAPPEDAGVAYDSYVGLDVEDKIVLVLRYVPENIDPEARATLARYSGLRYKALHARELGARALLVVTGPSSPNAGETIPVSFDTALSGSGIVAASISGAVAERLFAAVDGKTLESAQTALDDGNPHVTGFDLPGVELTIDARVRRERRTAHNVVGHFPGETDDEWIVLGAHYDHLGLGSNGNSLARKGETGQVHNGADDNASGVAAVLEVAARLRGRPSRRPIAFAFWSGEELGLLGSTRFVREDGLDAAAIAAYLNFDMVGRVRDNRLTLQSMGSSPVWGGLVEQGNVPVGFDLGVQDDPYVPTDAATFYQAGVPTLNFFSGSHEDYHRPTDDPPTINYEGIERVARLATGIARRLAGAETRPEWVKVDPPRDRGGSRDSLRAFTGTIPDYTTEVEGLKLSGVVGGGPAEKAGLRGGDVIVEFAGQAIANIYDYTYALDAVKVDVPVTVIVLRDGERLTLELTPTARD